MMETTKGLMITNVYEHKDELEEVYFFVSMFTNCLQFSLLNLSHFKLLLQSKNLY